MVHPNPPRVNRSVLYFTLGVAVVALLMMIAAVVVVVVSQKDTDRSASKGSAGVGASPSRAAARPSQSDAGIDHFDRPPCPVPSNGSTALWVCASAGAAMCADVRYSGQNDGTDLQIFRCNGTRAQQWTRVNDGTLRVFAKCMDIDNGGIANGARVQLFTCNGTDAQQWRLESSHLRNPKSNRCLDTSGSNTQEGTRLVIWDCRNTASQIWTMPTPA